MPEAKDTVRKLFVERMKRDGRGDEWHAVVKKLMADTGKQFGSVVWEAMRQMGYEGPDRERELHAEHLKNLDRSAQERRRLEERTEIIQERIVESFDEAMRMLPDTASPADEIDWIRAHPAMARKSRITKGDDHVMISAEDILMPPHGRAPSKSAASALQHWANHPIEFFKLLLTEHKKKTDGDGSGKMETEEDLDEVERLLKEVREGKDEASTNGNGRSEPDA